jgi:hypothetical protein
VSWWQWLVMIAVFAGGVAAFGGLVFAVALGLMAASGQGRLEPPAPRGTQSS